MTMTKAHAARVLIADDSVLFRNVFVLLLENAGYQVTSVFDGREALEALRSQPFDLAILDNEMPNLNGIDTLATLRGFLPDLPVLICSGTVTQEQANQYDRLGVADLLTKPVNPSMLREKIAHILTQSPSRASIGSASSTSSHAPDTQPASPLTAGTSLAAFKLNADLARLREFRSVAILEGPPGSGRFELAINAAPASHCHKLVCHSGELSAERLDALLKPAHASGHPLFFVVLDADRLNHDQQVLLEKLVRGRLEKHAELSKRLRLVLCAQDSLCDLHFNEYLLMRAMANTFSIPDFSTRKQDWVEIAKAILYRASSGRETLGGAALKWIELENWPGNYMQLHRTIEIARLQARLTSIVSMMQIQSAITKEPQCTEPLFHDMLFHVYSGEE